MGELTLEAVGVGEEGFAAHFTFHCLEELSGNEKFISLLCSSIQSKTREKAVIFILDVATTGESEGMSEEEASVLTLLPEKAIVFAK